MGLMGLSPCRAVPALADARQCPRMPAGDFACGHLSRTERIAIGTLGGPEWNRCARSFRTIRQPVWLQADTRRGQHEELRSAPRVETFALVV